jgi:hypothetical protein
LFFVGERDTLFLAAFEGCRNNATTGFKEKKKVVDNSKRGWYYKQLSRQKVTASSLKTEHMDLVNPTMFLNDELEQA